MHYALHIHTTWAMYGNTCTMHYIYILHGPWPMGTMGLNSLNSPFRKLFRVFTRGNHTGIHHGTQNRASASFICKIGVQEAISRVI